MTETKSIALFWFRRDLRLEDNVGLYHALSGDLPVLPIFIFDTNILNELASDDPRVNFIYDSLANMQQQLQTVESGLLIKKGDPTLVLKELSQQYNIAAIYTNRDYEPYAKKRDTAVAQWTKSAGISFDTFKDQVIFEPGEVLKADGTPYTVYTPFKKQMVSNLQRTNSSNRNCYYSTE